MTGNRKKRRARCAPFRTLLVHNVNSSVPRQIPTIGTILFAVSLNALFCPHRLASAERPELTSEFIYDKAPFPSCHASTIVECEKTPIAAWFGGTDERDPDVGIWLSRQVSGKWTAPVEVANGVQDSSKRYPTWNPVLFQPRTGPLMLFYKVGPNPEEWWGMLMTSSDAGRTWSTPRRLPNGILGPIKNKPIELSDGTILAGSSTERDGWQVHFERSSDAGQKWEATPPVNDGKKVQAIQPSILIHKGGELQAVVRTDSNLIFQTWSNDGGRSWSDMTPTTLPNPDSGIDAVTLADGRQLIVYNHTPKVLVGEGRNPLNVAISDDGRQWCAVAVLEEDPGGEFSYPAVIQTADKLVHVTYTWRRERIKHVVLDPSKFSSSPIVNGAWPKEIKHRADERSIPPTRTSTLLLKNDGELRSARSSGDIL